MSARRAAADRGIALPAVIGAIASPVVIFWAAGYLLGFTRMAGTVTVPALPGVIRVTCAPPFEGRRRSGARG